MLAEENYKIKVKDLVFHVQKSVSQKYTAKDIEYDFLRISPFLPPTSCAVKNGECDTDCTLMCNCIKLGGEDMCVEYKWDRRNPTTAELQWLHTEGRRCVDDGNGGMEIRGENTRLLFRISVQLLRQYVPEVQTIEFLDNSHFACKLPNQKTAKIFLNHYYFLFHHGHTWYDEKMGAYPVDETQRETYRKFADRFVDPSAKPISFDFMNHDLNELFQPIWRSSNTWKDFFVKLRRIPDLCAKAYPWYLRASHAIRRNDMLPETWKIDVGPWITRALPLEKIVVGGSRGRPIQFSKYVYDSSICPDFSNTMDNRTLKYR